MKFGYGINYKYEGTLSHSFDRFYVVTKYELPKVENLKFTTTSHDSDCKYLDDVNDRKDFSQGLVKDMKVCNNGWNWSKDLNKQKIFHLTDKRLQANMAASSGLREKYLPSNFLCQNVGLYNIILL